MTTDKIIEKLKKEYPFQYYTFSKISIITPNKIPTAAIKPTINISLDVKNSINSFIMTPLLYQSIIIIKLLKLLFT